jgi:hypothetical protein
MRRFAQKGLIAASIAGELAAGMPIGIRGTHRPGLAFHLVKEF